MLIGVLRSILSEFRRGATSGLQRTCFNHPSWCRILSIHNSFGNHWKSIGLPHDTIYVFFREGKLQSISDAYPKTSPIIMDNKINKEVTQRAFLEGPLWKGNKGSGSMRRRGHIHDHCWLWNMLLPYHSLPQSWPFATSLNQYKWGCHSITGLKLTYN